MNGIERITWNKQRNYGLNHNLFYIFVSMEREKVLLIHLNEKNIKKSRKQEYFKFLAKYSLNSICLFFYH